MAEWIPVTERLPEKRKYVLVRYKNNDMAEVFANWIENHIDTIIQASKEGEG